MNCQKCGVELSPLLKGVAQCPNEELFGSIWYMEWSPEKDTWVNVTYVLGGPNFVKRSIGRGCKAVNWLVDLEKSLAAPRRVIYAYVSNSEKPRAGDLSVYTNKTGSADL